VTGGPDTADGSDTAGGHGATVSSVGWSFAVRELRTSDLPRIIALEHELFGAGAWSAAMLIDELDAPGRWYVAATDTTTGRIDGYAGLWFDGDDAQIMTIGTATDRQRQGIARVLLAELTARAISVGAKRLLLEVRVDNDPALAMYAAAGFVTLGRRRKYYQPEGIDAWTMALDLASVTTGPPGAVQPVLGADAPSLDSAPRPIRADAPSPGNLQHPSPRQPAKDTP